MSDSFSSARSNPLSPLSAIRFAETMRRHTLESAGLGDDTSADLAGNTGRAETRRPRCLRSGRTRAMATSAIGTTAIAVRKNASSSRTMDPEMRRVLDLGERGLFASVSARRQWLLWCRHQKKK